MTKFFRILILVLLKIQKLIMAGDLKPEGDVGKKIHGKYGELGLIVSRNLEGKYFEEVVNFVRGITQEKGVSAGKVIEIIEWLDE